VRIVAGEFKGRRLLSPPDKQVRPTSDKVKEALFSILGEKVQGAVCCDLFAGTGSLGLEAVSRGSEKCFFCDNAGESIKLIKENVKACRAEDRSEIIHSDYRKALSKMEVQADIFFLDPPYKKDLWEKSMEMIAELGLLAPGGVIAAEHQRDKELPDEIACFKKTKERRYGTVVLSLFV